MAASISGAISRTGLLIGCVDRGRRCGGRHHLRALRHQDAEAHRAPRRRALRRQHRAAGLLARKDDKGKWSGFDVDFCRAIAAAIFDDPKKVQVRAARRQGALRRARQAQGRRAGAQLDLDDVARDRILPAFRRRVLLRRPGLHGAARAQHRIRRSSSTAARSACRPDTTTELNLADYFRANNMKYEAKKFAQRRRRVQRL